MKRYLLVFAAFLCTFSISCNHQKMEVMSDYKIGFVNGGEQMISVYNALNEIVFESAVYKSGVGNGQTIVKVDVDRQALASYNESNNTTLELLPENCYTIENDEFTLSDDNVNTVVKIRIDIQKLSAIQGTEVLKYAVPLKLSSSGGVEVYDKKSRLVLIPEITGGIRPNSATTLFTKTFEEMGFPPIDANAGSFAVSSKYLFVNARGQDLRYYDRFTGEYVSTIPLSFKGGLTNFAIANDEKDNLLLTNFKSAAGGLHTIYRIKGTGAPVKYIEISHANISGRKISITGDLDKDAIIICTIDNSSKLLYWTVKGGVLSSQAPQLFTTDAASVTWATNADAVALDVNIDKGVFISGTGARSVLAYFGKDAQALAQYDLNGGGFFPTATYQSQGLSYAEFNDVKYLAVIFQQLTTSASTTLLNVNNPQNLSLDPNSQKLIVYKGDPITTANNGNKTADVHLKVSDDKETMIMYSFATNGGIVATQFDSKASD